MNFMPSMPTQFSSGHTPNPPTSTLHPRKNQDLKLTTLPHPSPQISNVLYDLIAVLDTAGDTNSLTHPYITHTGPLKEPLNKLCGNDTNQIYQVHP
jgi:hypothetical protein